MVVARNSSAPSDFYAAYLFRWCWRPATLAVLLALIFLVGSAFSVVRVTHINRQLYAKLQEMQRDQDLLESEYERLLLEQSAWSEYSRVEQLARSELTMKAAALTDTVVVRH